MRKAKLYHVFESCIFGKGIPDTLTIFVHLTTYTLRKQNCANLFFTLTTTQIQSTTIYASAYIQVSNLKIKPSKTKDAKKKKKKKKNEGHGGRSRVQCYQCYLEIKYILITLIAGEERCSIQTFPTTWQHTESGWIFLSTCLKERKF